jgi:Mrp family chromosome partitioning ATPase
MKDVGIESAGSEPTVVGAVRRYSIMVIAFALAGLVAAVAYTHYKGHTYRAQASVTVPPPSTQTNQDAAQYLDSQVLLMESPATANRAASLANATLQSNGLSASDFSVPGGSVSITPPIGAATGAYGSSIVAVSFSASSATTAQVGVNSLLQAFINQRSATIAAQFQNAIAGIDSTMNETTSSVQLAALQGQRTQLLVNEQIDLAQLPTVAWAVKPSSPSKGGLTKMAAMGLVFGLLLGAGLAYARASRRRGFIDRQDPAALYGVPRIGEIPAFEAEKPVLSKGTSVRGLPVSASPDSAEAEAFRFAAGSLERIRAAKGPRLSLVFVSPLSDVGKSMVVANLALAIADGGTRVLAVDANVGSGDLAARLLPGIPADGGMEHVIAGQRELADLMRPSPLNSAVSVLRAGPPPQRRVTGAARSRAVSALLATAKSDFDVVLVDSPALLEVADATELVDASDAVVIVLSPGELVQDHVDMVDRLKFIGADIAGYIYNRSPMQTRVARYQRNGSSDRSADTLAVQLSTSSGGGKVNGGGAKLNGGDPSLNQKRG